MPRYSFTLEERVSVAPEDAAEDFDNNQAAMEHANLMQKSWREAKPPGTVCASWSGTKPGKRSAKFLCKKTFGNAELPTQSTARQQEKAPHGCGASSQDINCILLLGSVLLSRLVVLTALLAALSGILRLLAGLLVRLTALLLAGLLVLSALVLLAALLILVLVGH